MRKNDDGSLFTWQVRGIASGELVTVDDRTFDPAHHVDEDGQALPAAETTTAAPIGDRAARAEALEALPAIDIREIAEGLGITHQNKATSLAAILAYEFPE